MSARMVIELPGGKQLLLGGTGPAAGLAEVGLVENVVKAGADGFRAALGTLGELCAMLDQAVGKMPNRPDKVEMEFRASLSGECDLWIFSGDGEAEFKVKLAWGKGGLPAKAGTHGRDGSRPAPGRQETGSQETE